MLGQSDLHFIDCRLRQIKGNNYPFGGLVLLLCGDPGQLPPVRASSLWDKNGKAGSSNFYGLLLYQQFDIVTKLTKNFHLDENDSDAVCYNNFLLRLCDSANTREDPEWIKSHCSKYSMSYKDWEKLNSDKETVHLFATNKEVAERNADCIKNSMNQLFWFKLNILVKVPNLLATTLPVLNQKPIFARVQKFLWRRIFFNKQDYVMVLLARSWLFYMIGMSLPQGFLSVLWLILVNLTLESLFFTIMLNKVGFQYFLPHIHQTKQMAALKKNSFISYHISFTSLSKGMSKVRLFIQMLSLILETLKKNMACLILFF